MLIKILFLNQSIDILGNRNKRHLSWVGKFYFRSYLNFLEITVLISSLKNMKSKGLSSSH